LGDHHADERNELVLSHLWLVRCIAADLRRVTTGRRPEWDDVSAEGNLGLVKAADHWRPERSASKSFAAYARVWAWAYMWRAIHGGPLHLTGLNLDRLPAPRRPPTLVPLFGCLPYTPTSACPHHGPIPRKSDFVCMRCHVSGWDHLTILQLQPGDLPRPERRRAPAKAAPPGAPETRRQRRARLFGAPRAAV